jgi:hypothetical protein
VPFCTELWLPRVEADGHGQLAVIEQLPGFGGAGGEEPALSPERGVKLVEPGPERGGDAKEVGIGRSR